MRLMTRPSETRSFIYLYKAIFGVSGAALIVFGATMPLIGVQTTALSETVIAALGAVLGGLLGFKSRSAR